MRDGEECSSDGVRSRQRREMIRSKFNDSPPGILPEALRDGIVDTGPYRTVNRTTDEGARHRIGGGIGEANRLAKRLDGLATRGELGG
jgi:hypothetical protein